MYNALEYTEFLNGFVVIFQPTLVIEVGFSPQYSYEICYELKQPKIKKLH
jgi:hypothetical protein